MRKSDEPKLPPFSLRLKFEERARLEHAAAGMSLGAYVRWRLFDPDQPPPRRRVKKAPIKDHQALAQVLGQLGQSRLANNLNQLARAVNTGTLEVNPETEAALREAAAEVQAIRRMLIAALDLSDGPV